MFIAKNEELIILAKETKEELEEALQFMVYTDIEETDIEYELYNGEYLTKDEIAIKEHERIGNLTCTKRVFALMLQELGITYSQLKTLIASNEQAELEWDLCVELERKNPLLDIMASQMGITSEQLDKLFQYANGEITLEEFRGIDEDTTNTENTTDIRDEAIDGEEN